MAEVLSVANVIRIAESGEPFMLNGAHVPVSDLVAIAAAASRSGACVKFSGLAARPLEDLMRITVASQGHVILDDGQPAAPVQAPPPRRSWFGLRPKSRNGVRTTGKERAADSPG